MIVTPCFCRSDTVSHISLRSPTSTPAVGSSRNSTLGSWLSALAISTRRFMPPDRARTCESFLSHSDNWRSTRSRCASSGALPNSPREKRTVFITVSNGSRLISCGTSPISRRAAR